jgi:hypothetical protein
MCRLAIALCAVSVLAFPILAHAACPAAGCTTTQTAAPIQTAKKAGGNASTTDSPKETITLEYGGLVLRYGQQKPNGNTK